MKEGGARSSLRRLLVLLALIVGCTAAQAQNADQPGSEANSGTVAVELNRVQDVDGACRLTLVFTNALEVRVDTLALETVLFDADGQVDRFVGLQSEPLSPGKIQVQQYDVRDAECQSFGRLLLNDISACSVQGVEEGECLELIAPSSRIDIPFVTSQGGAQQNGE